VQRLKSEIAQAKPTIVHSQYGSITAAVGRWVAGSLPLIVSFRGDDLLGTPIPGKIWRVREQFSKWIGLWGAHQAAKIIVMSQNLWQALPPHLRHKAMILGNGVDINVFTPLDQLESRIKLGWNTSSKIVLFNASIDSNQNVKNLPLAQRIITRLVQSFSDKVTLQTISNVRQEQVCWAMNAADCLLVTSLHEGSPDIVKEAMACNLPVVSVPCGDVAERLQMTRPGGIRAYDADALADLMFEVFQTGHRSNGREQIIAQKLTLEDVAERIDQVYRQVQRKP
jgi:teichuronic acid biosynthesis glycosyltransferase TuaC